MTSKPHGFDGNGKELLALIRFKARYVIVLSAPKINGNPKRPNVIVAPIVGIHEDEMDKPYIRSIMNRDIKLPTAYYLAPAITGEHCYIDLAKIRAIPKNWLLREKATVTETEVFDGISERIGLLLSLSKLARCDDCKKPCDKCEMKSQFEVPREHLEVKGA